MYYILLWAEQSGMLHTQVAPHFHFIMDTDKMLVSLREVTSSINGKVVYTRDKSRQLLHKDSEHFVNSDDQ